jgi:L-ribulokinase
MCGAVLGGITPGLWGFEAGQSGVGDIFGWFVDHFVGPAYHEAAASEGISLHEHLSRLASEQEIGEHGLVALDWESGNRSVLVDHDLSGVIVGLTLGTRPPDVYRALVESTAFGARKIVETFESAGVPVQEFVVAGGLLKNPFVMQIYADVLRRPLHLIGSDQGPALGSAIHAAVAAEAYPDVRAAADAMGRLERDAYAPDAAASDAYDELYALYERLHDHFGRSDDDIMHRLRRPTAELVN